MEKTCCALCAGASWEEYFAKLTAIIERVGWAVQGVGGSPEDGVLSHAYTIGLSRAAHPEFIIFGLPTEVVLDILNGLARRVVAGEVFTPGPPRHDIVGNGYAAQLIGVADPSEHLPMAQHYSPGPLPALQVVWPDASHRFPWDEGCRSPQPVLGARPRSFGPFAPEG